MRFVPCCTLFFFFFQAEDGIRDVAVTGVQTCALPIYDDAGGGQKRCSSRPNAIAARIDRSADGDGERADHAEARAMRTDRRSRRAEIRKPGDEPADRRAALHPREPHPGAGVDARDEREVAVRRARDVETVRVREARRVTVGGPDPERDERSRVHRDATEHRVAYGAPIAELVRALEAEELLDRKSVV